MVVLAVMECMHSTRLVWIERLHVTHSIQKKNGVHHRAWMLGDEEKTRSREKASTSLGPIAVRGKSKGEGA